MAVECDKTVYMTFDTGSQSQAAFIADTLRKHQVKATFFVANEKTVKSKVDAKKNVVIDDFSLDQSWAAYWQGLVADGHAFGTHTFDHVYLEKNQKNGKKQTEKIAVKPQFGARAGQVQHWTAAQYCAELRRSDAQFQVLTGLALDPLWRAPGGRVNAQTLSAGAYCGYQHVGWAEAGFLGDELPSHTGVAAHSNQSLLNAALKNLRDGDITMAHLGIWSRQDAWAPAVLEPLIVGLKQRGFCFATLKQHPNYASKAAPSYKLKPIKKEAL